MVNPRTRLLLGSLLIGLVVVGSAGAAIAHGNKKPTLTESSTDGRRVSYTPDPDAGAFRDVALKLDDSTILLAHSITLASHAGDPTSGAARRGAYVISAGDAARMGISNGPGGFRAHAAAPATVTITLPEDATITLREAVEDWSPAGATIDYGAKKANLRLSPGATLALHDNVITVTLAEETGFAVRLACDEPRPCWHAHAHRAFHGHRPHEAPDDDHEPIREPASRTAKPSRTA